VVERLRVHRLRCDAEGRRTVRGRTEERVGDFADRLERDLAGASFVEPPVRDQGEGLVLVSGRRRLVVHEGPEALRHDDEDDERAGLHGGEPGVPNRVVRDLEREGLVRKHRPEGRRPPGLVVVHHADVERHGVRAAEPEPEEAHEDDREEDRPDEGRAIPQEHSQVRADPLVESERRPHSRIRLPVIWRKTSSRDAFRTRKSSTGNAWVRAYSNTAVRVVSSFRVYKVTRPSSTLISSTPGNVPKADESPFAWNSTASRGPRFRM